MSIEKPAGSYGFCTGLFVTRKAGGDSFIIGGVAQDSSRWTRVLAQRAAQIIWQYLGKFLYPERTAEATAFIATAPFRNADAPTITSHASVDKTTEGMFQLQGWAGDKVWIALLSEDEARTFWTALDHALYPNKS
jgi:hypothetical protein